MKSVSLQAAPSEIESEREDTLTAETQVLLAAVSSRLGITVFASEDNTDGIYIRYTASGKNATYLAAGQVWIDPLRWQGPLYLVPKSGSQLAATIAMR